MGPRGLKGVPGVNGPPVRNIKTFLVLGFIMFEVLQAFQVLCLYNLILFIYFFTFINVC